MAEYAKCSLCNEKDLTENLLIPCKCNRWVHRSCLNKKRIESKEYFDRCPVCEAEYCMQQKQYPNWRKYAEIYGSLIRDLMLFATLFLAASFVTGTIARKLGIQTGFPDTVFGGFVICGVVGFVVAIYTMIMLANDGSFFILNAPDMQGDNMLVMFVVIGVIALVVGTGYWFVKAFQDRLERHERAFGVKEKIVLDYAAGTEEGL